MNPQLVGAIVAIIVAAGGWYVAIITRQEQSRAEALAAKGLAAREHATARAAADREQSHRDAEIEREKLVRSGSVATTQADNLWAEGTAMRQELREQLRERDERIDRLEVRVQEALDKCAACEEREKILIAQLGECQRRLTAAGL